MYGYNNHPMEIAVKLKDSTVIVKKNTYTSEIQQAVEKVYAPFGLDPVCTSGNDGKHKPNSEHYKDRALDIRFWDLLRVVADRIKAYLPPYYDVVVEKDHFHIEADSKKEAAHAR